MKTTMLATGLTLLVLGSGGASAQSVTAAPATAGAPADAGTDEGTAAATARQDDDPDLDVNPSQPDFTLATLPTTLRMPRGKFAFRVTHRFGRPLGDGDLGDLASDLFGLDSGGVIGLEVRYGLLRGTQVGVLRTSDRTIQFFGQQQVKAQSDGFPLGLAVNLTAEGTNNFKDSYSPSVALVVSREVGQHGALYVEPTWVSNTNALPGELVDDNDSLMVALGARLRVSRRTYLVVEAAPRVAGYDPGSTHVSAGVEMRAGGHAFQLNVSRGLATTMAQVARGGTSDDWFIGFNISRKFW